jgi:AcrR family transcriptional regulator
VPPTPPSRPASASEAWQPDVVTQAPERLSREEKKARTRAQLIDAAATVFARRGYLAASLDEVAEEAGLTKGAVYSNFDSKEDLFSAVIDERFDKPLEHEVEAIGEIEGTQQERAMAGARLFIDAVQQERELFLLALERRIYVARHPEHAPALVARYREQLGRVAEMIADQSKKFGLPLPLPPGQMAIAVEALSQGMELQRLVDPEGVPDDLLGRVYALLFQLADEQTTE